MLMKHSGLSSLSRFHTPESSPPTRHPTVEQTLVFQNPKQCYQTEKGKPVEAGAKGQNQIKVVTGLLAIVFVHLNGSFKNHTLQKGKSKHKQEKTFRNRSYRIHLRISLFKQQQFSLWLWPKVLSRSPCFCLSQHHPPVQGTKACLLPSAITVTMHARQRFVLERRWAFTSKEHWRTFLSWNFLQALPNMISLRHIHAQAYVCERLETTGTRSRESLSIWCLLKAKEAFSCQQLRYNDRAMAA